MGRTTGRTIRKDVLDAYCEAYFTNGCNMLAAYTAAHPQATKKSCRGNSWQFHHRPEVQEALNAYREQIQERTIHAAAALDKHLLQRIFFDVTDAVTVDPLGSVIVKDINTLPPGARKCIRGITATENGTKIEFESRDRAIETYCKLHGLLKDRVDVSLQQSEKFADIVQQLGGKGLED